MRYTDRDIPIGVSLLCGCDLTCYTESYQSWEVVTAGQVVYAWQPQQWTISYETDVWNTGCHYDKCANGYAFKVSNWYCTKGHCGSNTWASGYPVCPHGYILRSSYEQRAHCYNGSEWEKVGYRAPCGRTTYKTEDQWGYVTHIPDVTALPLTAR